MRYRGSEAFDLDRMQAESAPERERSRSLTVVEGGHLDADARRGVTPEFMSRARVAVVLIVFLCVLGVVRVALTAGTVALMRDNQNLTDQIQEARDLNDDLKAERSLLSSSTRISKIATEVYGMVYNPATTSIDVGGGSVDAAQEAN